VPSRVAVHVEPVGVGELVPVAVGRVVGQDDPIAGVDHLAADLDVLEPPDGAPCG